MIHTRSDKFRAAVNRAILKRARRWQRTYLLSRVVMPDGITRNTGYGHYQKNVDYPALGITLIPGECWGKVVFMGRTGIRMRKVLLNGQHLKLWNRKGEPIDLRPWQVELMVLFECQS